MVVFMSSVLIRNCLGTNLPVTRSFSVSCVGLIMVYPVGRWCALQLSKFFIFIVFVSVLSFCSFIEINGQSSHNQNSKFQNVQSGPYNIEKSNVRANGPHPQFTMDSELFKMQKFIEFSQNQEKLLQSQTKSAAGIQSKFENQGSQLTNMKSLDELYSEMFYPEIHSSNLKQEIDVTIVPELKHISKACPRDVFFYTFNPNHRRAIACLETIIMSYNSTVERIQIANTLRYDKNIHPKVWYYALTRCSIKDPNLQRVKKPLAVEVMPEVFINKENFEKAINLQAGHLPILNPKQSNTCIMLDGSYGNDNGIENSLWYFREDIQLNSHYWYWDLSYPVNSQHREDRRGELFYHFHQSILSRYDAERLSNGLPRITAMSISRQGAVIEEGYFPHLTDSITKQCWTYRNSNIIFTDLLHVNNTDLSQNVYLSTQILASKAKITGAIAKGLVLTHRGQEISLISPLGIDVLGDIIQASVYSVNPILYSYGSGGMNTNGHKMIALSMDPQYITRTPPGPMGDSATSMRDIIFYRWHTFVNDIFDTHKMTLPPYTPNGGQFPLLWSGVHVSSIKILTNKYSNHLQTFWNQKRFPFNHGLNFQRKSNSIHVDICAKHLDHEEFIYEFVIDKQNFVLTNSATVRIFLAPRFDEQGIRFVMSAQRYMFFILDIFNTNLNPGRNILTRNSTQSSLTIPFQVPSNNQNSQTYCGCGWPHHLLIPKGMPGGMVFDLFVIITNGDEDAIIQTASPPNCITAPIHCGIPNGKYPDARPMGYPFDRLPYQQPNELGVVPDLDTYVKGISNIGIAQVLITHNPN